MKALGLLALIAGVGGLALHGGDALSAASLLLNAGGALPGMLLAQCALTLLAALLFLLFAVSGLGMLAGKAWGANLARRLATGLVLLSGILAIALYLAAVGPAPQGSRVNPWILFAANLVVGMACPIVVVAALGRGSKPAA